MARELLKDREFGMVPGSEVAAVRARQDSTGAIDKNGSNQGVRLVEMFRSRQAHLLNRLDHKLTVCTAARHHLVHLWPELL